MTNGVEEAKRAITEACEALKTSDAVPRAIDAFRDFLLAKNKAYGNSIYEPVRVFTNASIETLILVRLNDKATRLLKGESGGEDAFDDLLGYLILRKALPLYLTFDTKEGQDALDLLPFGHTSKPRMVPHSEVQAHLAARGLRVGMTFAEVRDNLWTQCEATQSDADGLHVGRCTEGDPCSACKFLDGALCKCGHPFTVHHPAMASFASDCHACPRDVECPDFSLASWTNEPLEPERDLELEEIYRRKAESEAYVSEALKLGALTADWSDQSEGHRPQSNITLTSDESAVLEALGDVAIAAYDEGLELGQRHKKGPTMADTKKPRVNRATWHDTDEGKDAILRVTVALTSEPVKSWYAREVANEISVGASDVSLALEHLLTTGAVVKHGKAKGTRYAVAGFTDWPAPLPRGKKPDDQFAEEEPPTIVGTHGAT